MLLCLLSVVVFCIQVPFISSALSEPAAATSAPGAPSAKESQPSKYRSLLSGMEAYQKGEYQKALDEFLKASILFPDDPDIPFYIGLTHLQLNKPQEAIPYFKATLQKDPEYLNAHFQLGTALAQTKAFKEAAEHLERVYQKDPQKENLGYFLGFSHYRLGEYQKALTYLEQGKTNDPNIANLTKFYIGLSKQQLGRTEEAKATLTEVAALGQTSPLSAPSERIIEMMEGKQRPSKRFDFQGDLKLQYDDNLILVPSTNVFNLRGRNQKSFGEALYLNGAYFFSRSPDWESSISYGFFGSINNDIKGQDVQDHILSLDSLHRTEVGSMPLNLRLTYTFDTLSSGNRWFLSRQTIRPMVSLAENDNHLTALQYTLQLKRFHEDPAVEEEKRTGTNNELGFVHFVHWENFKNYIKFGYFYDNEDAKGANWDYLGNKVVGGFQFTPAEGLRLTFDYEKKGYNYPKLNTVFAINRKDNENVYTLGISKDLSKEFTLHVDYLRRISHSNIPLFDFSKNVYAVGVTYSY